MPGLGAADAYPDLTGIGVAEEGVRPVKIHNPFRVALVGTLGVGLGLLLIGSVQTLSTILLYVGTALFLSLGLDPVVGWLERRKLPRWAAVLVTILAVLAAFAGIILMVVPIIVGQIGQLIGAIQDLVEDGSWDPVSELRGWLSDTFPLLDVNAVFEYVQQWWDNLDFGQLGSEIGGSIIVVGGTIL